MQKPRLIAALAFALACMPAVSMAAAKKPVVKTASFAVCPSYKANAAARRYPTLQEMGDAVAKLGAKKVNVTLCGGTYDQDFDVASAASFSFKGTNVIVRGSGAKPDAFRLVGSGSLTFARGIDFKADESASAVPTTAIRIENPGAGRGSLTFLRNNVSGFAQAIALVNADLKLQKSNIVGNHGGDGTATISVQGASCGKGNANVTFEGSGVTQNTAALALAFTNANVKINDSTFDTNTGAQGLVSGSCQRITASNSAFFMNDAGASPLFTGSDGSTLSIRTSSVFRNTSMGGDDFAQGYDKVTLSADNVSQNVAYGQ